MNSSHSFRQGTRKQTDDGIKAKENFCKAVKHKYHDCKIKDAHTHEDINEHWDVKITHANGYQEKDDVKEMKSFERFVSPKQDEYCLVELLSVNQKHGWARGGADKIAFECKDYFFTVDRKLLLDLTIETIKECALNLGIKLKPDFDDKKACQLYLEEPKIRTKDKYGALNGMMKGHRQKPGTSYWLDAFTYILTKDILKITGVEIFPKVP